MQPRLSRGRWSSTSVCSWWQSCSEWPGTTHPHPVWQRVSQEPSHNHRTTPYTLTYMSAKIAHIVELYKPFGVFAVFHPAFLWCFIRHSCGISSDVFVVFQPMFLRCFGRCFCSVSAGVFWGEYRWNGRFLQDGGRFCAISSHGSRPPKIQRVALLTLRYSAWILKRCVLKCKMVRFEF